MFLVLVRHEMDDLPVRLFETRPEAESWIASAEWERPGEEMIALDSDASTPIAMSIVEFRCDSKGEHGLSYMPKSIECIRSYYKEEDATPLTASETVAALNAGREALTKSAENLHRAIEANQPIAPNS